MEYKWKALSVVSLGSLMGSIDSTVLLIGFPSVASELHASLVEMVWVLLIYLVMGTALVLSLGRLADMKGRRRLYLAGFLVFTVGSALCGFAGSGLELIAFRAVQGVGGAMLIANAFAIVSDAFPPTERGAAFGLTSIVWGVGSVFGIFLGGLILSVTTWRWIFWINLPVGAVAMALGRTVLRESVVPQARDTFDFPAAALFIAGLVALLFGITEGILTSWTDPVALGPIVAAVPVLLAFYLWERSVSRDPILPLSLFSERTFSLSLITSVLQGIGLFAANFLLMAYFQGIRGVSVLTASYLLIPLFVALMAVAPYGGRLADRYGPRHVATAGLLVQATAMLLLSTVTASTSLASIAAYEGVMGVGGGLFFPANTVAIMGAVPRARYGVASGAMMTFRNSSIALSYVLALVIVTARLPAGLGPALLGGTFDPSALGALAVSPAQLDALFIGGLQTAFVVSALLVCAAAGVSSLRRRPSLDRLAARREGGVTSSVGARPPLASEAPRASPEGGLAATREDAR